MKKGFTLIEMLVTVGLFTIIITIAVGGFTNAIRTQRQVSSLIAAQSNVSLALEQMTRTIRTGYLFCNTVGNTQAAAGNNPSGDDPDCGCVLSSTISPSAPSSSWTCSALDFYNAEGSHIYYFLQNGTLVESSTLSAASEPLVGSAVSVKYLRFQLYGQVEDDHAPPRVTISLGIAPSSTDPGIANTVINLQTTVSARSCPTAPPARTRNARVKN